jgi:hypothetical protein
MGPVVELGARHEYFEDGSSAIVRAHSARARLVACRPVGGQTTRLLRWLDLDTVDRPIAPLLDRLKAHVGARNFAASPVSSHQALVRLVGPVPPLCAATFSVGGVCARCPITDDGPSGPRASIEILVPRARDRARLVERLGAAGPPPELRRTGRFRPRGQLTPRQDEALRVAYRLGFLSYPRRADLRAIAQALGVGRSTALELLRRATTQLAMERFGDGLQRNRLS